VPADHVVERLTQELVHVLRALARRIDSNLAHYGDGLLGEPGRLRAGAVDLEAVAGEVPQQSLRHLASGLVPLADVLAAGYYFLNVRRETEA
jgi:hypothetical protein